MEQWLVLDPSRTPICCEACSVLGLSVSVFIVPSKRTCIVQCAAYDPVSHRHAVEGECKRQLCRLLYVVHVRPCGLCGVCRMVVDRMSVLYVLETFQ